jgi:hypothetical protein
MKKIILFAISSLAAQISFGQYTRQWPDPNWPNTSASGYVGIGIKPLTTSTTLASFNLQLHGTSDYFEDDALSGMAQDNSDPKPVLGNEKALVNYGKTTRLGLTNSTTGMLSSDGVVLRMSGNNFTLANRETGNLTLSVPTINMVFNNASSRIEVGSVGATPITECAKFNVATGSNNNGLYIYNTGIGNYGLSVRTTNNTNDAIRVMGSNGSDNVKNFSVKGNGEVNTKDLFVNGTFRVTNSLTENEFSVDNTGKVRAREILVDENTIPDYVFKEDYKLMPLNEVEQFVTKYHHLPNVKSELEFKEAGGVDLGEMNLKLLEKVEELTLYVIDLQKQIEELKNK